MPNGEVTQYRYDGDDELTYVDHGGRSFGIERDALGREASRKFGAVELASAYDAMDRLVAQRATRKSEGAALEELVSRRYQYDARGRVTRIDDKRWGETNYSYVNDRLARVGRIAGISEVFDYDTAGALVGRIEALTTDSDVETRRLLGGWEIGPGNRLLRTDRAKYKYDARGRRTSKVELSAAAPMSSAATQPGEEPPVTTYTWDAWDRLRAVTKPDGTRVAYRYDALGRRVNKRVEAERARGSRDVRYFHDGDAVAAEIDPRIGVRTFVHEPGTLVPMAQSERRAGGVTEVYAVVTDHLGAPKELVDGHGVAWAARHTAFGAVAEEAGDGRKASSPFRLLGQFADDDVGLSWTRYRVFDAETGRWLSGDPLGLGGGSDLFGFDGAPTVDVDPLGLMADGPAHGDGQDPALKNGWKPDPKKDLDWRGSDKDHKKALDEAFKKTGEPKENFEVTKWGKTAHGKSIPVEWRSASGAEVNMDVGHVKEGPGVPHVGYQTGGKRGSGGATRGHILLDDVPANR